MNWKTACFVALAMWSAYGFFGERAAKVHGDKINLLFETGAFILLSLIAAASGISDFQKVTINSAWNGSIMGLLSAGGFWFVLYAMKISPQQDIALVLLISGMFPVGAAVISNFVTGPLSVFQWVGVAMAGAGMIMINIK
jgi:drug/metabolite transporter (DMT)-like permease